MWGFERKPEKRRELSITFLGEQDGPPERELKHQLTPLLGARGDVRRAYLARGHYRDAAAPAIMLCIAGPDDPALASAIGRLFAASFAKEALLDILFLDEVNEQRLNAVCEPFYRSP